jgi:hypothetical protein
MTHRGSSGMSILLLRYLETPNFTYISGTY